MVHCQEGGDAAVADDETVIYLDEIEQLCGRDGGMRWDDGTVTACMADGTVVKVLRRPGDPPLRVAIRETEDDA